VPVDLDRDGWIDFVLANDMVQNFVFHNLKNGTFEEIGVDTQIAFAPSGEARGAMGIDAGYFRNDDTLAVGIGNFANEMTAFYVSQPNRPLVFKDTALSCGIGPPSRVYLKFGVLFLDVDLDGRLDFFEANGHLENEINMVQASQTYPQPPQLFWNAGPDQPDEFLEVPETKLGSDFRKPIVGRGTAFADIDGDGDLDLLVIACGQSCRLLRNDQQLRHQWIRFDLKGNGQSGNRDAIGAWIEVHGKSGIQRRQVMPTRGYLAQSERLITLGIGKEFNLGKIRIHWPDGKAQDIKDVKVNAIHEIQQP
jgi:hypothetical protein